MPIDADIVRKMQVVGGGVMPLVEFKIVLPVFKCVSDEEIFYQRLSEITGLTKVVDAGTAVQISVEQHRAVLAGEEIAEICRIWHCLLIKRSGNAAG